MRTNCYGGQIVIYLRKIGFAVMGIDPEKGVDHALSLLGHECLLTFGGSEKEAIEKLKNNLKKDWVLIGPVGLLFFRQRLDWKCFQ